MYQRQEQPSILADNNSQSINHRTPLQRWIDVLHVFENDIEEADKEDDVLYLIKQYARLQLSSISQLRADYKTLLKKKCPPDLLRDAVILAILEKLQHQLREPFSPDNLPADVDPMDYNEEKLERASRGCITRLVDGTVIERTYNKKTYVIYCRKGFYEYKGEYYNSLTEVARLITGTLCSGPSFFSKKSKIYIL